MITVEQLVTLGLHPTQARLYAAPLSAACDRFDIDTAPRVAGFIAQCRVESVNFTAMEEGLYYSTPERIRVVWPKTVPSMAEAQKLIRNPQLLANTVYAGKNGNGDFASGDGWRFRGRGIKQLTGRANYHDAAVALGRPYVEQPDLVAQPEDACLTAAWFWHTHKLSVLADSGQWDAITRVVNGPAMLSGPVRRQWSEEGARALA